MINKKNYTVLGIMTGTSMDGIDLSLVKTDGKNYLKIIKEKNYQYSILLQNQLKKIVVKKPKINKNIKNYFLKFDDEVNNILIKYITKFINEFSIRKNNIDIISLSGQTMYHNPKKRISIQLGSGKKISKYFKINVITDYRINDIKNGGQGAPIGSYYHRYLLKKIDSKALIINFGGIANITFLKNNKLISSDIGPANSLSDDLTYKFYKKQFDKMGKFASSGNPHYEIIDKFAKDIFFNLKIPKSLDRNYFIKYFNLLTKINKNDAICTANHLVIKSIEHLLSQKNFKFINSIIITGGGRKNHYLYNSLIKKFKPLKIIKIDKLGYNGDLVESQMFGYLAVRSIKKFVISSPNTTGVSKSISGGKLYKI